jgi:Zn-finger nucleic acid-binding protein
MNVEALNCPNCGAAVSSDSVQCRFCESRLKTQACPKCLGLMFIGSEHCSHCGAETVAVESSEGAGDCPRCRISLTTIVVGETDLEECARCGGMWSVVQTFERLCADAEAQAAVLTFLDQRTPVETTLKISYVPCPECEQLMNRSNFARSSGVIIDICKAHGVWFDAEELPKIIAFIRSGGIDAARQRERLELEEERRRLRDERVAVERHKHSLSGALDEPESGGLLHLLLKF